MSGERRTSPLAALYALLFGPRIPKGTIPIQPTPDPTSEWAPERKGWGKHTYGRRSKARHMTLKQRRRRMARESRRTNRGLRS